MNAGLVISSLRETQDLSLRDLEKMSGISNTAIHKWEKGISVPRVDGLQMVLEALGYKLQVVKKEGTK
ncbi:MAG: helix-turn-helix transcriptional regulator [Acetobacterium sp.]|uniref:helix-turn-helix domain-containing protein n=1 Tax=Acetobacterium sp. TaxID=1872094 RepID=UPI003241FAF2